MNQPNQKQQHFNQLYRGSVKDAKYCQSTNVSQDYLCPKVSKGEITEMPQHAWFQQQSQNNSSCHPSTPNIGRFDLCSKPSKGNQSGGYVVTTHPTLPQAQPQAKTTNSSSFSAQPRDPYSNFPAQAGYFQQRCIGNRNLYPGRQQSANNLANSKPPVPPLKYQMTIQSNGMGSDVNVVNGLPSDTYNLPVSSPEELTNVFVTGYNITPSFYPDMTQNHIGKRPVYTARNQEAQIPHILTQNVGNLPKSDAGCKQPNWKNNCV